MQVIRNYRKNQMALKLYKVSYTLDEKQKNKSKRENSSATHRVKNIFVKVFGPFFHSYSRFIYFIFYNRSRGMLFVENKFLITFISSDTWVEVIKEKSQFSFTSTPVPSKNESRWRKENFSIHSKYIYLSIHIYREFGLSLSRHYASIYLFPLTIFFPPLLLCLPAFYFFFYSL